MRTLNAITRILLMLCGDIVALSASDHKTCKKSKRTIVFTKARNQVMNVGEFTDEAIVFLNNNKMERPIEEKKRRRGGRVCQFVSIWKCIYLRIKFLSAVIAMGIYQNDEQCV